MDVTVYEPTSDAKTVKVGSRLIVFQPNGANLLVGEEYALQNQSQPPVAYFNEKGDFNFEVPDGRGTFAGLVLGAVGHARGAGNHRPRQSRSTPSPTPFSPAITACACPIRFRIRRITRRCSFTSDYAVERVMLVAPPTVQVTSAGFSPAGTEQGFNLYTRDAVPAGLPFDVSVSGTAPPPSAQQQAPMQRQRTRDKTAQARIR